MTNNSHIESLIAHGAKISTDQGWIDLTTGFYQDAVETCQRDGYVAITYNLQMPDIEEPLMLAIWKDGHADSGSVRAVCECLTR